MDDLSQGKSYPSAQARSACFHSVCLCMCMFSSRHHQTFSGNPHRSVHNLKAFTPCLLFARQESYDHDDDSRFLQRSLHVMVVRFDPKNYWCALVAYHFAEHSLKYLYLGIAGSRFVSCSHVCRCFPHLGAPLRLRCHIRLLWKHLILLFFFQFRHVWSSYTSYGICWDTRNLSFR